MQKITRKDLSQIKSMGLEVFNSSAIPENLNDGDLHAFLIISALSNYLGDEAGFELDISTAFEVV